MPHHCICNYTAAWWAPFSKSSTSYMTSVLHAENIFPQLALPSCTSLWGVCKLQTACRPQQQICRVLLSSSVMFWKSFTDNHLILHEWRGNQVSVLNSINENSCLSSQKPPWMQLSQSDVYENKLIRQEAHLFRVCVWKHTASAEPSLCSKCEGQVGWNLNVSGGPKVAGLQVGGERRKSWG